MSPRALTSNAITLLTGLAKFQATVQGARYGPKLLAQMLEAAPVLESTFSLGFLSQGLRTPAFLVIELNLSSPP